MDAVELGHVKIYKMRELNHRTAAVVQEINDSGQPALVTRHGRFVALITPLLHKNLEGKLIAQVLEDQGLEPEQRPGTRETYREDGRTVGELAKDLGIKLP